MSSIPIQKAVSFDEDFCYESIGSDFNRYSVGSAPGESTRLLPWEQGRDPVAATSRYQSTNPLQKHFDTEATESRYHSDQGVDQYRRRGAFHSSSKPPRTGRQRKKAARTKDSEFQTAVVKRRIYFCCVSSEIDLTTLESILSSKYSTKIYGDALCLTEVDRVPRRRYRSQSQPNSNESSPKSEEYGDLNTARPLFDPSSESVVFIFEFGTVVFWGLFEVEEMNILAEIRKCIKIGEVEGKEFESGEDDMAFIPSSESDVITITNDLLRIPQRCHLKELLAVSYAISQSTVLAIFEERIDQKVEEYKFIPETLSAKGKISIPLDNIGMMIGDIFVIRHGLNLHSDILDTPDFFWEEDRYKPNYLKMKSYLEMDSRITVLNKRLDMLKELLDMLQHQIHNAHATKLEWIVIWLIIIEVAIEVIGGGGALLGLWTW